MFNQSFTPRRFNGLCCVFIVCFLCVGCSCQNQQKKNFTLGDWKNIENRVSMLSLVLAEDRKKFTHETALSNHSPVYGLTEKEVIALIGSPDRVFPGELVYELGNLELSWIDNQITSQNATLNLYFIDDKCERFMIST